VRLEPSPTQQSPATPLQATALEPFHAGLTVADIQEGPLGDSLITVEIYRRKVLTGYCADASLVATPLAPSKQAEGIGSASSHCPPAPQQEGPLGDSADAEIQTPRASSTGKPNISPGAGSDNTEMLPGSCAMSEVMPGSSAAMSDMDGSARMSVDGCGMSEDGDGAAQLTKLPAIADFPFRQTTGPLSQRSRFSSKDMLVDQGVRVLRPRSERCISGDLSEAGRSDTALPSPSPMVTPSACARTGHASQDSGVSVFYAATIGSKCIHVGNTLHLEKFSFKCWLCWSPVSLLTQLLWGCQRLLLSCVFWR
jgi:hypothetical protein